MFKAKYDIAPSCFSSISVHIEGSCCSKTDLLFLIQRWRELEEQAKEALGDAATHVASVEEAETIARTMRIQADVAER